jgi:hypothetical protein
MKEVGVDTIIGFLGSAIVITGVFFFTSWDVKDRHTEKSLTPVILVEDKCYYAIEVPKGYFADIPGFRVVSLYGTKWLLLAEHE